MKTSSLALPMNVKKEGELVSVFFMITFSLTHTHTHTNTYTYTHTVLLY